MEKGLDIYKSFIDGLVKSHKCVASSWILKGSYPQIPDNENINKFLSKLSLDDKQILSKLLQETYDSGIHDTLAYMDEKIDCDNLLLSEDGTSYITDEFESMHFDFICRKEGDEWPDG